MCVYASDSQTYGETGRWENVLGYSWVWTVISWPLNWSRCLAGNPRGPSQIWLPRSPQPADDKHCGSRRANPYRMFLWIHTYANINTHRHNRIYRLSVWRQHHEGLWSMLRWDREAQRKPYVWGWAWQSCSLLSRGNSGWGDEFITALRVLQEARLAQIPHERKTCDINRKMTSP